MQILKFGGTSVANAENIEKVTAIIKRKIKEDKINEMAQVKNPEGKFTIMGER